MKNVSQIPISPEFEQEILKLKHLVGKKQRPVFMIKQERNGFLRYICMLCSRVCNSKKATESVEIMVKRHLMSKIHLEKLKMSEEVQSASKHLNWPHQIPQTFDNGETRKNTMDRASSNSASTSSQASYDNAMPSLEPETAQVPIFETNLVRQLQNQQSPFIGAEYIVEFVDGSNCFLCNGLSNRKPMIKHVLSENHQMQYLRLHFPSVLNFINEMESRIKEANVMFIAAARVKLDLLTEATATICNNFGVMLPKFCNQSIFTVDSQYIAKWIDAGHHYNEMDFPSIMNMFNEGYMKSMMIESVARIFPSPEPWNPFLQELKESESENENSPEESSNGDNIDKDSVSTAPSSSDDEEMKHLADADYKVLLDNFDSLKPQEQERLVTHIRINGQEKFENLRKILTNEGAKHLEEALLD